MHDPFVRGALSRIARELPASASGALALAAMFVAISALSAVSPPGAAGPEAAPSAGSGAVAATGTTPATQPIPTATPMLTPSLAPTARPTTAPGPPLALAVRPEAGGIVFRGCCEQGRTSGVWRYDGRTGTVTRLGSSGEPTSDGDGYVVRRDDAQYIRVDAATGAIEEIAPLGALSADAAPPGSDVVGAYVEGDAWLLTRGGERRRVTTGLRAAAVRFSPTGRTLAILAGSPHPLNPKATITTELWAVDLPDGTPRLLTSASFDETGLGPTLGLGRWSPDGTLLTYWEMSISNSLNADGVGLRAVDIRTGRTYDLGVTLYGAARLSWKAPHTLAYVSGGSRMTWRQKSVRIWSPEAGATDIAAAGIGLNPSWSADGTKLYFINADEHEYDPLRYFAGRDSGDRRLTVYDLATGTLTRSDRIAGRVHEGVRAAGKGKYLLTMWRTTHVAPSLAALPPVEMHLSLFDPTTGQDKPLVRIASGVGFGYYGSYAGPEGMAWSEGR